MSALPGFAAPALPHRRPLALLRRPVAIFLLLSALFGLPAVFLVPPLRGADEPAHFLRAYGLSHGEIVPSLVDAQGRKGIFLPAHLNDDYALFESARYRFGTPDFNYRQVFAEYWRHKESPQATERNRPPVFVLYAGSEGYAPVAYIPYAAAAVVARMMQLDFVPMLFLMRLAGFVVTTAMAAYAIAIIPFLRWPFLFIALLPIALYERAIVSADGAALSAIMVVTALCLKAASRIGQPRWERPLWMTLCVLIKPSHTAFILLEGMATPFHNLLRRWRALCVIIGPGLILSLVWTLVSSADVAAWRMIEGTGEPPEHFNVVWKLGFMLQQPQHFLHAALGSLSYAGELWRESIGVLGWRDTPLPEPIHWLLTAMLVAVSLAQLDLDAGTRVRVAVVAGVAVIAYCLAVFLIFYLAWTPIETTRVHGIQGRYFTIALPPAVLAVAAAVNRAPREPIPALIAFSGALISGGAMIDAVIRTQW
jgi:uncharacterized membrane protein